MNEPLKLKSIDRPIRYEDYQILICDGNPVVLVNGAKKLLQEGWIPLGGLAAYKKELRAPDGLLVGESTIWSQAFALPAR